MTGTKHNIPQVWSGLLQNKQFLLRLKSLKPGVCCNQANVIFSHKGAFKIKKKLGVKYVV